MKVKLVKSIGLGIIITSFLSASASYAIPIEAEVNEVVSHLVGVMETTVQAANNSPKPVVRMTTCQIKISEEPNSIYLYQEQALTDSLNQPYRQRILEIKPSDNNQTVESKAYKPVNPNTLIGLCNQPESQRQLDIKNLGNSVCSVYLKPNAEGFIGKTPEAGCPANVRGAVRITNTVILHNRGMDTWDRGFDAQGNQVWGAQENSYQYRWVQKGN